MTAPVDITTVEGMRAWLRTAKPGARCTYHRGNLMRDRQVAHWPGRAATADTIGTEMWNARSEGLVELHLKRIDGHGCAYIAVRRAIQGDFQ